MRNRRSIEYRYGKRSRSPKLDDDQWTDYYERRIDYFNQYVIGYMVSIFRKYGKVNSVMKYIDKIALKNAFKTLYEIWHIGKKHGLNDPRTYNTDVGIDTSIFDKSTGIDGIGIEEYNENRDKNISVLYNKLINNKYRMKLVKRIYIPKDEIKDENGKVVIKYRPLSIACIEDSILQIALLYQIIVPITEEIYVNESFAYRPRRSVNDAIKYLEEINSKEDIKYILAVDIKSFFDNIIQDKLIEMVKEIIPDGKFLKIIKIIIETEYYDVKDKGIHKPNKGIYQGINIAPVLANLYLHNVIDTWYKGIDTKDKIYMIRYADDVMILTKNYEDVITTKEEIKNRFEDYGLTMSEEKTEIINFDEETIPYLGYLIKKNGKKIYKYISEKTIKRYKKKADKIISISLIWSNETRSRHTTNKDYIITWTIKYLRDLNNRLMGIYKCYKDVDNFNSLYIIYDYTIEQIMMRWSDDEILKNYLDLAKEYIMEPSYVILYNLKTEKRR